MSLILASPLGVFGSSIALAATENVAKIAFTNVKMDAKINEGLELRIQTQNTESNPEILTTSANAVLLESSSPTGKFYSSCTNLTRSINKLTMRLNSSNASLCYVDSTPGNHKITVRPEVLSWVPAEVSVSIVNIDPETSPSPTEPEPEIPNPPENNPPEPPVTENPPADNNPVDVVKPDIEIVGVEEGGIYSGDITILGRVSGKNTSSSLRLYDVNGNTTEFKSVKSYEVKEHILLIQTNSLANGQYRLALDAENRIGENTSAASASIHFYIANELPRLLTPEVKSLILEDSNKSSEVKNIIGRDFLIKSQKVSLKASGSSKGSYQLEIYYPDGSSKVINSFGDIFILIDDDKNLLDLDGSYQIRVRQIAANNTENANSEWSDWFSFEITPVIPVFDSPNNHVDVAPSNDLAYTNQTKSVNKNSLPSVSVVKGLSSNLTISRQSQLPLAVKVSKGQDFTASSVAVKPSSLVDDRDSLDSSMSKSESIDQHDDADINNEASDGVQDCYRIFGICWYNYIIPVGVVLLAYSVRRVIIARKSKQ